MPNTTVNYGFRIPLENGDDYIIPDDIRLPVTDIDTIIKTHKTALDAAVAVNTTQTTNIATNTAGLAAAVAVNVTQTANIATGLATNNAQAATITAAALTDTGWDNSGILASAAGWSNISGTTTRVRIRNGVIQLFIGYTRTGATIVSSVSSGAMADTLVCTLGLPYRPDVTSIAACQYGGTNLGGVYIDPAGNVKVYHGAPGVDIDAGNTIYASFMYLA